MVFGSIAAIISGCAIPFFGVYYGKVREALVSAIVHENNLTKELRNISTAFLIIAFICLFTGSFQ